MEKITRIIEPATQMPPRGVLPPVTPADARIKMEPDTKKTEPGTILFCASSGRHPGGPGICAIPSIALLFIIGFFVLTIACQGTETTNPGEEGQAPTAAPTDEDEDYSPYSNGTYGTTLYYPAEWDAEYEYAGGEPADDTGEEVGDAAPAEETRVVFTDGLTSVAIEFEDLGYEPASLRSYLSQNYPMIIFTAYTTDHISGYIYDSPSTGPSGGDLKEYYFLNETILLHVTAEIFSDGDGYVKARNIIESIQFTN